MDAYDQVKTTLDLRSNTVLKVITKIDTNTDNLKKTTIFSPTSGTVLNKNIEVGEMVVGANSVSSGTEMMKVADLKDLEVSSYVNEIDVTRLHVGQEIDITVDSTPGVDYSGVVTHVAPMSSSSSGSSAGSSSSSSSKDGFEVRIAVKGDVSQLKMGMTANITAILKEVKDALAVPLSSVFCDNYELAPSNQKYYVYVEKPAAAVENGKQPEQEFEKRDVTIGVTDTSGAEVTSGLKEGEKVAIKRPPSMSEPTRNHDWMRRGR